MMAHPQMQAAPKRPRLSLKINTCGGPAFSSARPRGFPVDPTDPTAFNTLSNAYVAAISTVESSKDTTARLRVTTPYASSPPQLQLQQLDSVGGPVEHVSRPKPQPSAPYTHPRSLHSILRNSPCRQSSRLHHHHKAAKRVGYNNPLTQTITTNKYTLSHIDLLVEEASPAPDPLSCSPAEPEIDIDLMQAFSANEIQDGGQTPGPFEDLRRRLAGLGPGTPLSPTTTKSGGIRKRRKRDKEKKRQWVWTIGVGHDGDDDYVAGAMATTTTTTATAGEVMMPMAMVSETPAASIPLMAGGQGE